jgi:Protein of unknown function (DUF4019)
MRDRLVLLAGVFMLGLQPHQLAAQQPDSIATAIASAQAAASAWLALVDQGNTEASWDSAAAGFRQAVTRTGWARAVQQARGPFAPFGDRHPLSSRYETQLPNAPPGRYVILQYETDVSQGRKVVETVVPSLDPDGRWRVGGYFIRPR